MILLYHPDVFKDVSCTPGAPSLMSLVVCGVPDPR